MGTFDVLIRLAQQAVDRERQALQAVSAELADCEQRINNLAASTAAETADPLDFRTTGATLAAYLQANRLRIRTETVTLANLRAGRDALLARLKQQRIELKRYERLAERRARQAAEQAAAQQQKEIDELVTIKAGREAGR